MPRHEEVIFIGDDCSVNPNIMGIARREVVRYEEPPVETTPGGVTRPDGISDQAWQAYLAECSSLQAIGEHRSLMADFEAALRKPIGHVALG